MRAIQLRETLGARTDHPSTGASFLHAPVKCFIRIKLVMTRSSGGDINYLYSDSVSVEFSKSRKRATRIELKVVLMCYNT
jgi:hypothetical protein